LVVREIRLIHTPDVKHRFKAAEQRLAPVRARCDTMEQALQAMARVQVDGGGAIPTDPVEHDRLAAPVKHAPRHR